MNFLPPNKLNNPGHACLPAGMDRPNLKGTPEDSPRNRQKVVRSARSSRRIPPDSAAHGKTHVSDQCKRRMAFDSFVMISLPGCVVQRKRTQSR